MAVPEVTQPRTRTLWILAAVLAVTGVLLVYPWNTEGSDTVESPQPSNSEPNENVGRIASLPPPLPATRPGAPSPEPTGPAHTGPANGPEPWRAAATGFADALTARAEDHAEWVAGLEPWVTRHLAEQYEQTDPARRPRGTVDSVETIAPGDYSAHVRIIYDSGLVLLVRIANGPDGWRVTYAEPVAGY